MKSMCCLCIQFTHENTSERTILIWLLALQKRLATPLVLYNLNQTIAATNMLLIWRLQLAWHLLITRNSFTERRKGELCVWFYPMNWTASYLFWLGLVCITIFHWYRGGQFYWWRNQSIRRKYHMITTTML
jgi:hypothetical protein